MKAISRQEAIRTKNEIGQLDKRRETCGIESLTFCVCIGKAKAGLEGLEWVA